MGLRSHPSLCEIQAFVSFFVPASPGHVFVYTPNTSIHSETKGFSSAALASRELIPMLGAQAAGLFQTERHFQWSPAATIYLAQMD